MFNFIVSSQPARYKQTPAGSVSERVHPAPCVVDDTTSLLFVNLLLCRDVPEHAANSDVSVLKRGTAVAKGETGSLVLVDGLNLWTSRTKYGRVHERARHLPNCPLGAFRRLPTAGSVSVAACSKTDRVTEHPAGDLTCCCITCQWCNQTTHLLDDWLLFPSLKSTVFING